MRAGKIETQYNNFQCSTLNIIIRLEQINNRLSCVRSIYSTAHGSCDSTMFMDYRHEGHSILHDDVHRVCFAFYADMRVYACHTYIREELPV